MRHELRHSTTPRPRVFEVPRPLLIRYVAHGTLGENVLSTYDKHEHILRIDQVYFNGLSDLEQRNTFKSRIPKVVLGTEEASLALKQYDLFAQTNYPVSLNDLWADWPITSDNE